MTLAPRPIPTQLLDLSAAETLADLTAAADRLMREMDLGGYKFCIASADAPRLVVLAVISGGDLAPAETLFSGQQLTDPDEPLARTYWSQQTVLWSEHLSALRRPPGPPAQCSLTALNVTCGASIPILSRSGRKRASLCVSGGDAEPADAFDRRFPDLAPALRMGGLAMVEFGLELARQRAGMGLTPTEAMVLDRLAAGARPKEIAASLDKSEYTVRNQIAAAREKLGAASALEAVAIWTMRAP